MNRLTQTVERLLVKVVPSNPIAMVVRIALLKELALLDQIEAYNRDGIACVELWENVKFNHKIAMIGLEQLK